MHFFPQSKRKISHWWIIIRNFVEQLFVEDGMDSLQRPVSCCKFINTRHLYLFFLNITFVQLYWWFSFSSLLVNLWLLSFFLFIDIINLVFDWSFLTYPVDSRLVRSERSHNRHNISPVPHYQLKNLNNVKQTQFEPSKLELDAEPRQTNRHELGLVPFEFCDFLIIVGFSGQWARPTFKPNNSSGK